MALDVKKPIDIKDIATIELVKDGKVIILHGYGDDKIVLKVEKDASLNQVKNAKAVMKAVDPSLKTKIVSREEAETVIDAIDGYVDDNLINYVLGGEKEPHLSAENLETLRSAMETWIGNIDSGMNPLLKMSFVEVKDVRSMLGKRLSTENKSKADLRSFAEALNAPGGLEKLGSVIAADMMNDNHDRFSIRGGVGQNIPTKANPTTPADIKRLQFQAVSNIGNIFLQVTDDGGKTLSGLDFIPPVVDGADINKALAAKHPIHTLVDPQARTAFAEKVARDLEKIINPKRGFLGRRKLDSKAARRLVAGMVEGARKINIALKKKALKQNPVSVGLQARIDLLDQVG